MAEASQLDLKQVPKAFAAIGDKHNALVNLLRTMTGTGMASVVFSEGKIIINVPTVSTTGGGSVTVPDPLTIGTINVTNLNATNESVSYLTATSITSGSLNATNVNATTVTATQFWGDLSATTITSTDIKATTVTATQFAGNLKGTTVTATTLNATSVSASVVTAGQFYGNLTATVVTANDVSVNYLSAITVDANAGYLDYLDSITIAADHALLTNIDATTITATHFDGNITSTSITVSYQLYSPRINANVITTNTLSLNYLSALTVDSNFGDFTDISATSITATRFWGDLSANTITATIVTASTVTATQFYGNLSGGTVTASTVTATNYLGVNLDVTTVTATHIDGNITTTSITVSYELNSPRIVAGSSTLNSSGLTVSNGSYSASLLFAAMTHNMSIKEIDVCSGGVAKKMLILASDPY